MLSVFLLEAYGSRGDNLAEYQYKMSAIFLIAPLNMLPSVKYFTLRYHSDVTLLLTGETKSFIAEDEVGIPPRVLGHTLPRARDDHY